MLKINSFLLLIVFLKYVDFVHSANNKEEVSENDIPQQQQPSILSQNVPKFANAQGPATEMQRETEDNLAEGNDRNNIDEGDVTSAGQQSNDLNEMINQIKEVEINEQLELNNDLSSLSEGNPESGKSEENLLSTNLVATTLTTPIKGSNNDVNNLPELEVSELMTKTTAEPQLDFRILDEIENRTIENISLLKEDEIIFKQSNTNISKEKISLPDKTITYAIPEKEKEVELKSRSNERENNNNEDYSNRKNTLHSVEDEKTDLEVKNHEQFNPHDSQKEIVAPHVDQHPLKLTEDSVDKDEINNKAEESEEQKENHVEELSLWEKILLGLRCARQDCQDTFIIEEQDEQPNKQRLIKGWKITRARRDFVCPCKNIPL
uniref:Candidate secreted effector n=1 Tax=Meloidogyne incognita TaxID=6306 RepID=A0A914L3B3_MELIC